jgi:hypothetical protein
MRRRVVALLLILVVAGFSDALAVCQALCGPATSGRETASHAHHAPAGHESSRTASDGATVRAAHHDGCHRAQAVPFIARAPERSISAVMATTAAVILPSLPVASIHAGTIHASGSPPVSPNLPLRI